MIVVVAVAVVVVVCVLCENCCLFVCMLFVCLLFVVVLFGLFVCLVFVCMLFGCHRRCHYCKCHCHCHCYHCSLVFVFSVKMFAEENALSVSSGCLKKTFSCSDYSSVFVGSAYTTINNKTIKMETLLLFVIVTVFCLL